MAYKLTLPTKLKIADRRAQMLKLMKENPGILHTELAKLLGVDRSTVQRDLKIMTEEMNLQNRDDFLAHQKRLLEDIQVKKALCMEKLEGCSSPTQGARWMEEHTKLVTLECKLLSMFSPEKILDQIDKKDKRVGKAERDAAVAAVFDSNVIPLKSANPSSKTGALPEPA